MSVAIFAAGCFWGVEDAFRKLDGVIKTEVGYTGGKTINPTYKEVCTDTTGHAEAVRVEYDESVLPYEKLLETFWSCHDPTQQNRQGPDIGSQYRSAIFYLTPEQKELAQTALSKLEKERQFSRPIATELTEAAPFYMAEDYHQQYFEKRGLSTCRI